MGHELKSPCFQCPFNQSISDSTSCQFETKIDSQTLPCLKTGKSMLHSCVAQLNLRILHNAFCDDMSAWESEWCRIRLFQGQEPFAFHRAAQSLKQLARGEVPRTDPLPVTSSEPHWWPLVIGNDGTMGEWTLRCLPTPGPAVGRGLPGYRAAAGVNYNPVALLISMWWDDMRCQYVFHIVSHGF